MGSDVPERVAAFAREADGHVLLLAGGALAGELAAAGVLDELFLVVGPIALGRGRPLLDVVNPLPTRLLSAQELAPSCPVMRYAMVDAFPERGQPGAATATSAGCDAMPEVDRLPSCGA
jgi:dihydrofolate reductase